MRLLRATGRLLAGLHVHDSLFLAKVTGQFGCDAIVMKLGGLKESDLTLTLGCCLLKRAISQLPKR